MAGSPEFLFSKSREQSCATTLEARQTLGAFAFEVPSEEQAKDLWRKFHVSHGASGDALDDRGKANLSKLEIASLSGNAQAFADVVRESQTDPSADNALKAFQAELTELARQGRWTGTNLVAEPNGSLSRRDIFGARVEMKDTGEITFSMNTSTTHLPPCGETVHSPVEANLTSLTVSSGLHNFEPYTAFRANRTETAPTNPEAFFNRFSPALENELEQATRDVL